MPSSRHLSRRLFMKGAALLPPTLSASLRTSAVSPITDVVLDLNTLDKWDTSNGDTWDPFWADDDNLYVFNCDGRGFGTKPRNLAFNALPGDRPDVLTGSPVNSMDEYGKSGAKGPDNATWKACGQECIDAVFYAFVSRNVYGSDSHDRLLRQTAANSSLIKSTDRGRTWTRSAAENYSNPMWPGARFGAPFFVHYGKNGGSVTRNRADRYVYATSTNRFWNDGDYYVIGRIERSLLPNLNPSDWMYFTGGDGEKRESWSRHIETAKPILSLPGKCGQGPACYIPSLSVYLMISWYNTAPMTKWFEPNEMKYDFYQAEHPWGPWRFVCSHSDNFIGGKGHMYGPSLCAKFQSPQGSDVKMSLFTAGCPFEDRPTGLYKIWRIPLVLKTTAVEASTVIRYDDATITYQGEWTAPPGSGRQTAVPGTSAQLTFIGSGVACLAEEGPGLGDIQIYLDGTLKQEVSLRLDDFPPLSRITVFAARDLPSGRHVIRLVNKATNPIGFDGFKIYHAVPDSGT